MKVRVLKDGDKVISVNNQNIAVQQVNGDVDIIPLTFDEDNMPFVDTEHIVTITYGDNTIETIISGKNEYGSDDISVMTF